MLQELPAHADAGVGDGPAVRHGEVLEDVYKRQQLSRAVEQADRANAAKTSFLSRMTHDIRTPLNGIIGLLEIDAAHPEDTALVNANREKMRVVANHLLALINDILQMSKLESGEVTLAHELVDLDRLTVDILTIVGDKAAESGVTLEYDKSSYSISTPWVYGSPVHLRQDVYKRQASHFQKDRSCTGFVR